MPEKLSRIFLLLLLGTTVFAQTVFVPADNRVYDYLERMESRGLLTGLLNGTRPMTRLEIAGHLVKIHEHKDMLSKLENRQLDDLVSKFREELPDLYSRRQERMDAVTGHAWIAPWLPEQVYNNGRNLFAFEHQQLKLFFDPVLVRSRLYADADTLSGTERVFEDGNGLCMWGTLGEHVGFVTDVRDTKEWGTRDYPGHVNTTAPGVGFVSGGGDHIYHDETRAYLVYNHSFLTLQYGKDENQWGTGKHGQLFLSDAATSYDLIKVQVQVKSIKFTCMWGVLQHYTPDFFYGDHQEKYLAAHRFEFAPFHWLNLGLHESVIYSERKFEPAYLNPVMFFRSAEHYLGDRDNAAMGLDFEAFPGKNTKIYGELYIDDLTTGKLGSSFYGNKYAWLAGLYHVDPLGFDNSEIRLEYARIRPFTYTHKTDINSYRHYSTGLGHPLGPNAEELYLQVTWRPAYRTEMMFFALQQRHGANTDEHNAGGSLFSPHEYTKGSETAPFLDGVRERTRKAGIELCYELFYDMYLSLQYSYGSGDSDWYPGKTWPGDRSEFFLKLRVH